MGALRLSFGVLALGVCVAGSPRIAHAESDRDRAAARSAADAGADAYDQQRYADAVELFTRAEKLVHATPHLLFIARSLVKLGRLVEAHETYLKIQREKLPANAPSAFKRAQADAEKEIVEVAPRLAYATIRVEGAPSDAVQVFMDEIELPSAVVGIAAPVDPGVHVFRVQSGTDKGQPVSVRFDEGARHGVVLKITLTQKAAPTGASDTIKPADGSAGADIQTDKGVDSPPSGGSSKTLLVSGIVVTGIGVVGAAVGGYFVASAISHRNRGDDLFGTCDPSPSGCTDSQRLYIHDQDELARKDNKRALYTLIPAGVFLATGVTLIVLGSSSRGVGSAPKTTLIGGVGETNWIGVSSRF
ncbi:MAG: hypothetical protein ACOY0T_13010 [Myxococcota bacterium]